MTTTGAGSSLASPSLLSLYALEPPHWRLPLTYATPAYPELYPGATALYPQTLSNTGQIQGKYAGQSRDAANNDVGIVGVAKSTEEDLSETAVKNGFVNKPVVQVIILCGLLGTLLHAESIIASYFIILTVHTMPWMAS